jgi:hypothetical protein
VGPDPETSRSNLFGSAKREEVARNRSGRECNGVSHMMPHGSIPGAFPVACVLFSDVLELIFFFRTLQTLHQVEPQIVTIPLHTHRSGIMSMLKLRDNRKVYNESRDVAFASCIIHFAVISY